MLVALVFLGQQQPVLTVQLAALTGSRGLITGKFSHQRRLCPSSSR
jgi:hypothetical protein